MAAIDFLISTRVLPPFRCILLFVFCDYLGEVTMTVCEPFLVSAKNNGIDWVIFHNGVEVRRDRLLSIRQLGMEAAQLRQQSLPEADVQQDVNLKDHE
jgi:hypothetical protein